MWRTGNRRYRNRTLTQTLNFRKADQMALVQGPGMGCDAFTHGDGLATVHTGSQPRRSCSLFHLPWRDFPQKDSGSLPLCYTEEAEGVALAGFLHPAVSGLPVLV